MLKRCIQQDIHPLDIKKPAPIITRWLTGNTSRLPFEIEKSCVLQDPNQQQRIIRCQQQNLLDNSIQALIKDGCEVKQIALSWRDQVRFVLSDDLSLRSISFQEDLIESAKEAYDADDQRFHVDFLIMSETLSQLFAILLKPFAKTPTSKSSTKTPTLAISSMG